MSGRRPTKPVLRAGGDRGAHGQTPSYEETDCPQIRTLYDVLLWLWPSPVVALNRAVAISMAESPAAALTEVEALERVGRLAATATCPRRKADMLRRLGRGPEAADAYRAAPALSERPPNRSS